jgi:glycosyltransferase 2 family protein
VATFLAALCGAIGWQYCLGEAGRRVHFYDLFLIRHIGETVGLVNPTGMVGGEALKAAMLHTKGVDRRTVVVSVVVSRALTIVTQLILFVVVLLLLYYGAVWAWLVQLPGWVLALVGLVLAFCWFFVRSDWSFWPSKAFKHIFQRLPLSWQKAFRTLRESLHLVTNQQRGALLWASLYLTLHWVFGGLEFYLTLRFIGADVTLLQAIFVDMGVVFFKVAGTMVPGQIGVEEYGNKVMLETIGLTSPEIWITASILRRARQLFWIGFGMLTYFIYYHKWRVAPSAE